MTLFIYIQLHPKYQQVVGWLSKV